jgi:putative oxidoreductase
MSNFRMPVLDWDLEFLQRLAAPACLVGRMLMAEVFIVEGYGKIVSYSDVADYMQGSGVSPKLLPLVIATELGGGLMILFGLKTRWAAIALFGFALLTALLFHINFADADQLINFQKNLAIAGGYLTLAIFGPGSWSLDAWRSSRH